MKIVSIVNRILLLLLFLVAVLGQSLAQRQPKTGLILDDAAYLRVPKKGKDMVVYKGILPGSFSLRPYAPEIGDQGDFGTCVAWSTGYYMRTMAEARVKDLRGQQAAINKMVLSPTFIYERAKRGDVNCQKGLTFPNALEVLKREGVALLSSCPYQCGNPCTGLESEASQFKILDYQTLFDVEQRADIDRITAIKQALVDGGNPVLIGTILPPSFFKAGETWQKAPNETPQQAKAGHAMAVIGYDNKINGGSFLIANSWGKSWGKDGYTWAKADDLMEFTPYAFQVFVDVTPGPGPGPSPTPNAVTLKGSLDLMLKSGGAMPVKSDVKLVVEKGLEVTPDNARVRIMTYSTTQTYHSGTSFKASANNNKPAYMYILGSDDENRPSELFPYEIENGTISPMVAGNATVMLPDKESSFTMDNVAGNDYFLVLYSEKELNLSDIRKKVKAATGSFEQRVFTVLGDQFMAMENIKYSRDKIDFEVQGNPTGSIVPLMVKIGHVK